MNKEKRIYKWSTLRNERGDITTDPTDIKRIKTKPLKYI